MVEKRSFRRAFKEIRGSVVGSEKKSNLTRSEIREDQKSQGTLHSTRSSPSQQGQGIQNFFEHRSEEEVYGDTGLTLFDSQKTKRNSGSTGSLFGIK